MLRHRPRTVSGKQALVTDHRTQSTPNTQSHKTRPTPSFLSSRLRGIITIVGDKPKPMSTNRPIIPLNITPFSASKVVPFWHDKFIQSRQNPKLMQEKKRSLQKKFLPLGIIHALADEHTHGVLFGSKLRAKVCESIRLPPDLGIENRDSACSPGRVLLEDMETSEDYTCVTIHNGPNPTTTHIFDDRIVGSYCSSLSNHKPKSSPEYFLSSCYTCKKNLQQTQDIYIYRGEKAFCSSECRYEEMMLDSENAEAEDSLFTI